VFSQHRSLREELFGTSESEKQPEGEKSTSAIKMSEQELEKVLTAVEDENDVLGSLCHTYTHTHTLNTH
jgi:hypothetical protein